MSGVNGGIDYDIDLDALPVALASRVRSIQLGPKSPSELISAAKYIASAAPSTPETLPVLVDMLGYNNPVAARIAVDALALAGNEAVPALLTGVGAFNYAVNAYALRALARIADPSVASVCVACATKGPIPGVRRAACAALAALHFSEESVAADAFETLLSIADSEPDWGIRYAAVVGIERFQAKHLLSKRVHDTTISVLKAVVNGDQYFKNDALSASIPSVAVDLTVVARATIALEALESFRETSI